MSSLSVRDKSAKRKSDNDTNDDTNDDNNNKKCKLSLEEMCKYTNDIFVLFISRYNLINIDIFALA